MRQLSSALLRSPVSKTRIEFCATKNTAVTKPGFIALSYEVPTPHPFCAPISPGKEPSRSS